MRERAHELRLHGEELIEADVNAYLGFVDAMRSARGMDAENRREVVESAREETIGVPLAIARAGAEVAELAELVVERGNPNLRSDARVACVLAAAGARAAIVTLSTNLADAPGDVRLAEAVRLTEAAEARARSGS